MKGWHTIFHLYEIARTNESMESGRRLLVAGGQVEHGKGNDCLIIWGFLLGWWESFGTRQRWWLPNTGNVLNASDFYTLKRLITLCEFYLIKNEQQGEKKSILFSIRCSYEFEFSNLLESSTAVWSFPYASSHCSYKYFDYLLFSGYYVRKWMP